MELEARWKNGLKIWGAFVFWNAGSCIIKNKIRKKTLEAGVSLDRRWRCFANAESCPSFPPQRSVTTGKIDSNDDTVSKYGMEVSAASF